MSNALPKHIAIIMDGNGRWAKKRLLPRIAGHRAGYKTAQSIIKYCAQVQVKFLTLFAFSSENWLRPKEEVSQIHGLMYTALTKDLSELNANNIKLTIIGDLERFNKKLQNAMLDATIVTKNNTGMNLIIAANYGGQWDIVQACRQIVKLIETKQIESDAINHLLFENSLATKNIPAPDLLIRTSGEQRISNFYIWQLAYTEIYFCEKFWPEFDKSDLESALQFYISRERRFGVTSEQLVERV